MSTDTKEQRFRERVSHWSETIGAKPKLVQLRRMKRKWASCSTAGRVSFSRDLLRKRGEFQDCVIAHELIHLQVPNHGKLFKSLMRAYIPNWEEMHLER
ncbi:MAG: metal-dependent hydrolase [Ignavibacteriales bacterium CG07_land_8_20_14_0_80_59_12]|nr:MAG: metal-dependent hydrolase [Ignavibacteriales bacterium CG07_land_8_20_14_0_80_59_12]